MLNMEETKEEEFQNENLEMLKESEEANSASVIPKIDLFDELLLSNRKRQTSYKLQTRELMFNPKDIKLVSNHVTPSVEEQTTKLINKVRETQIELEKEKKQRSSKNIPHLNLPGISNLKQGGPSVVPLLQTRSITKSKTTPLHIKINSEKIEESPKEVVRVSIIGEEMHIVPFKKKELENKSGIDHIPIDDDLSDIRHTKEYEESIEKDNVKKHLSIDQAENISKNFTAKISEKYRMYRSNSDEFLNIKSPKNVANKKRRNSVNKKIMEEQSDFMTNYFAIKGTEGLHHTGFVLPESLDKVENKLPISKFIDELSSELSNELSKEQENVEKPHITIIDTDFDRENEDLSIEIEEFTPKDKIIGVRKFNNDEDNKSVELDDE
jgi:hypothetical protein